MAKSKFRLAGWLAVAGLLTAAIVPSAAFAQTGNQTNVSSQGQDSDCTGGPDGTTIEPGKGQVGFLFVHASVDAQAGATLTANFTQRR